MALLYPTLSDGDIASYYASKDTGAAAKDQSGSNDGTLLGGMGRSISGGKLAYSLDGVDDRIAISPFNVAPIHLSMWVNAASQTAYFFTQSVSSSTTPVQGIAFNPTGVVRAFNRATGTNNAVGSTVVGGTGWRNVQAFFNTSGHAFIYVDGVLDGQATNTVSVYTSFNIGSIGAWSNGGSYVTGLMDDIRIYNRQLTSDERLQLASRRGAAYLTDIDTAAIRRRIMATQRALS